MSSATNLGISPNSVITVPYSIATTSSASHFEASRKERRTSLLFHFPLLLLVAAVMMASRRLPRVAGLTHHRVTAPSRFCSKTSRVAKRGINLSFPLYLSPSPSTPPTISSQLHTTTSSFTKTFIMNIPRHIRRRSNNQRNQMSVRRMTADGAASTTTTTTETTQNDTQRRTWNLPSLRKEVSRLTVRCHKKIGKTSQRLQKAKDEVDRLTKTDDVTMEELEACPNVDELEEELQALQTRLKQLNQLEVLLQDVKGTNVELPEHVAELAMQLEVSDQPSAQTERGPKKKDKGPKTMTSFRLPYRRFYTENNTEIRVGKQAQDNDELSLSPKHRDSLDWWMHASGCPGSHVIIRCHDQALDQDVVVDAAALAARQSKCTGNIIKVSMVRARDVQKPPGAKPGLVQLTGSVRTVTVNMKEAQARLERLDKTVLIN